MCGARISRVLVAHIAKNTHVELICTKALPLTQMHSPVDSSLTLSGNSHQGQSCSADVKAQFAVGHSALEAKA